MCHFLSFACIPEIRDTGKKRLPLKKNKTNKLIDEIERFSAKKKIYHTSRIFKSIQAIHPLYLWR